MTDGFPDRLTQLRNRCQADPSSRVFLQLAEEYRHLGRVKEALEVLDAGLKEHPGYLSALVAKGRCHLELGDAEEARTVLERVVQQDATQMVANKLLVRAYLEVADVDRARQRLDLYSLLNDSDPEVEELKRRIAALTRPPQAATERPRVDGLNDDPHLKKLLEDSRSSPPPPRRRSEELHGPEALDATTPRLPRSDVFDLDRDPLPVRQRTDVFDLDLTAVAPSAPVAVSRTAVAPPPPPSDDLFDLGPAPLAAAPAPPAADALGGDDDPFPELAPKAIRQRYLESLTGEGIFSWDDAPATAAPAAAAPEPEPPVFELAPAAVEPWQPEPLAPAWSAAPELAAPAEPEPAEPPAPPVAAFSPEAEPAAAPSDEELAAGAAPVAATATLGELYLRQGHVHEAERIFREILEREPGNAAVREALERTGQSPSRELDPRRLLDGFDPDAVEGSAADLVRAKKVHFLKTYLERLRQADQANVS